MPRLSPWQWIVIAVFLIFYGFAVFALTRDYYLRHPQPTTTRGVPPEDRRTWIEGQVSAPTPEIADALAGEDPQRLDRLADQLFAEGRYAEAIPLYRRILELTPEDTEAHNDLGLALHYTGDRPAALEVLERGVQTDRAHQRIWLTLGFVRAAAGHTAAAREALQRARSLDPETPVGQEAQRLLGQLGAG